MRWAAALLLLHGLAAQGARGQASARGFGLDSLVFRGIGGEVGRVWPRDAEAAPVVTLRGDLGPLRPSLYVIPSLSFWTSRIQPREVRALAGRMREACARQYDAAACPEVDLGEIEVSDLFLGVDLEYHAARWRGLQPFGSAGAALHLLNGQGDAIDGTFAEELLDAISPGLSGAAGIELRAVGPLRLRAEGRASLASTTRSVSLSVGGSLALPVRSADLSPSPTDSTR